MTWIMQDALDIWKNKLYEVSTRRCAHILEEEHVEYFFFYRYDGSEPVDTFISWIQCIPKFQRVCAIDTVLVNIPT
jgi:hypothetical protein